jgi:hypothetical protein
MRHFSIFLFLILSSCASQIHKGGADLRKPAMVELKQDGSIEVPFVNSWTLFTMKDPAKLNPLKTGLDYYLADYVLRTRGNKDYPVLPNLKFEDLLSAIKQIDPRLVENERQHVVWISKGAAEVGKFDYQSRQYPKFPLNGTSIGYRYVFVSNPPQGRLSRQPFDLTGHRYIEFHVGMQSTVGVFAKSPKEYNFNIKLVEHPVSKAIVLIVDDFNRLTAGTDVPILRHWSIDGRTLRMVATSHIQDDAMGIHEILSDIKIDLSRNMEIGLENSLEYSAVSPAFEPFDINAFKKTRTGFFSFTARDGTASFFSK